MKLKSAAIDSLHPAVVSGNFCNDLFCVEWDVKTYSVSSVTLSTMSDLFCPDTKGVDPQGLCNNLN